MFIWTIIFHNTVTTMLELAKFLTVRERQRFESISTRWEFIPNTNPCLPATVALGHFWYNSGPHFTGLPSAAQLGMTSCQDDQDYPTLGLMSSSPVHPYFHPECALWQNKALPKLSYLASWSERVIQPAKWEACVQNDMRASNDVVLNRHRWNHMSQPTHRLRSASSYISHGSFPW